MPVFQCHATRIAAVCALLAVFVADPGQVAFAQEDGLSFEQAQTRTAYARRQMETRQRALRQAEADEKAALQRLDNLKKRYEEARKDAEMATKARETAEKDYTDASERWSAESERLRRIHQQR